MTSVLLKPWSDSQSLFCLPWNWSVCPWLSVSPSSVACFPLLGLWLFTLLASFLLCGPHFLRTLCWSHRFSSPQMFTWPSPWTPYFSCLLSPSIILSRFLVLNITYVLTSDRFLFLAGFPFLKFRLICSIDISTPLLVILKTELLIFASRLARLISFPISASTWRLHLPGVQTSLGQRHSWMSIPSPGYLEDGPPFSRMDLGNRHGHDLELCNGDSSGQLI